MLANTGQWTLQAQPWAGKPTRKEGNVLFCALWGLGLDRPKEHFNIKILLVLKLIGTSRKSVQNIQQSLVFFCLFVSTVVRNLWNWLCQKAVETGNTSMFRKELDKSVDNKSIEIHWRKGPKVLASVSLIQTNADVGKDCRSGQVPPSWTRWSKALSQ